MTDPTDTATDPLPGLPGLPAPPLDTAAMLEALADDVAALVAAREEDQARLHALEGRVEVLAAAVLRLENELTRRSGAGHDGRTP